MVSLPGDLFRRSSPDDIFLADLSNFNDLPPHSTASASAIGVERRAAGSL
jgi:hypothetical protein